MKSASQAVLLGRVFLGRMIENDVKGWTMPRMCQKMPEEYAAGAMSNLPHVEQKGTRRRKNALE